MFRRLALARSLAALASFLAIAAIAGAQAVPPGTPAGGDAHPLLRPSGPAATAPGSTAPDAGTALPGRIAPIAPSSAGAVATVNAQRTFTYQGLLRNGGAPVNGDCELQVSLWDAVSGGTQLGSTQTVHATAADGLFTVTLNSGGEFGSAPFDGRAVWIEIAVRHPFGVGSFTTLTPRQALTATPLAAGLVPHATLGGNDSYSGYPVVGVSAPAETYGNPMGFLSRAGAASNYLGFFIPVGMWGDTDSGVGVFGSTNSGYGVYGAAATTGKAGYFQGDVVVTGKLEVPRFKTTLVLNAVGPLPRNSNTFTSSGGTLLVSYSGSGYATTAATMISMDLKIDGTWFDRTGIFANQSGMHLAFVSKQWVLTGIPAGTHTIRLEPTAGTGTDFNDIYNVVVTELPY